MTFCACVCVGGGGGKRGRGLDNFRGRRKKGLFLVGIVFNINYFWGSWGILGRCLYNQDGNNKNVNFYIMR